MTDRYLELDPAPEHVVFQVRLGLCVIDMAAGDREALQVANMVVHRALEAADAYAARDVLSHETCLAHTTADASQALTEMVRESGLVTSSGLGSEALEGPSTRFALDSVRSRKKRWPPRCCSRVITASHRRSSVPLRRRLTGVLARDRT